MSNILINGDFQIWQRGTEFWPKERHLQYTADRWNVDWRPPYDAKPDDDIPPLITNLGEAKISRQLFPLGQTEVPGGPKYYLRWEQRTPSSSSNWFRDLSQQIEDVRTFSGQQVTLSCYLRADRPATIKLVTEQFFGGSEEDGASKPAFTESDTLNVTTSWQRYSYSPLLESVAGKLILPSGDDSLNFIVSQKGADSIEPLTLDIADCQMELGPTLTAFERRTFSDQLAAAERYFQKSYSYDDAPGTPDAWASSLSIVQHATYGLTSVHLRRGMRRPPQVILFNPATGAAKSWRSVFFDVAVSAWHAGTNYFTVVPSGGFSTLLPNWPLAGHWVADAEFAWSLWWE